MCRYYTYLQGESYNFYLNQHDKSTCMEIKTLNKALMTNCPDGHFDNWSVFTERWTVSVQPCICRGQVGVVVSRDWPLRGDVTPASLVKSDTLRILIKPLLDTFCRGSKRQQFKYLSQIMEPLNLCSNKFYAITLWRISISIIGIFVKFWMSVRLS